MLVSPQLIRNGRDRQSAGQSCSAGWVGRRRGGPHAWMTGEARCGDPPDRVVRVSVLLQRDGITAADVATPQYRGVYADIDLVVLGCRAQDARILGQISLRQRYHNASGAGAGDSQVHLVS